MTTVEIIKKAKTELEAILMQCGHPFGKALDAPEYCFSQIGRAAAYLDIAIEQEDGGIEVIGIKEADENGNFQGDQVSL